MKKWFGLLAILLMFTFAVSPILSAAAASQPSKAQIAEYKAAVAKYKQTWSVSDVSEASRLAFDKTNSAWPWVNLAYYQIQSFIAGGSKDQSLLAGASNFLAKAKDIAGATTNADMLKIFKSDTEFLSKNMTASESDSDSDTPEAKENS